MSFAFHHLQSRSLFSRRLFIPLILCCISGSIFCQWDGDPKTVNNPILSFRSYPVAVSDDKGGAIVIMSSNGYLLAQRKSVTGQLLWNTLTTPVTVFNGTSITLSDVQKDGNGGAYIAFTNVVNGNQTDLYLQRLDSNGNKLFGENGVKVNLANSPFNYDAKLSAGKNGVTLVWANTQTGYGLNESIINNARLFIQRFSITGTPFWPQALPVSTAPTGRIAPVAVSDGNDGTYVIFTDFRNLQKISESWGDYYINLDIFMQYFDALGNQQWGNADSALSTQPGDQFTYQDAYSGKTAIPDSTGGFEIIYMNNDRLYAQRINSAALNQWPQDFNIGGDYRTKYGIKAISDGTGGLAASWFTVAPTDPFIYAQRVTAEGSLPWGSVPLIVNSPGDQQFLNPAPSAMAADKEGNYVFCWYNLGTDTTDPNNPYVPLTQLKAQKITSTGNKIWKPEGLIISEDPGLNAYVSSQQLLASDSNKVMAIWSNTSDSFPNGRITSAMINPNGVLLDNLVRISETIKDGEWNDPSIWADGKLPSQKATVIIKTNVNVSQHVTCKSLKVLPPGAVTVNTGVIITITG